MVPLNAERAASVPGNFCLQVLFARVEQDRRAVRALKQGLGNPPSSSWSQLERTKSLLGECGLSAEMMGFMTIRQSRNDVLNDAVDQANEPCCRALFDKALKQGLRRFPPLHGKPRDMTCGRCREPAIGHEDYFKAFLTAP